MKTKSLLIFLILGFFANTYSQNTIELTFNAIDSLTYVQLDSIRIMNRTQGGDTILYYPDTVLVLDYQVGIPENSNKTENFHLLQNYPNPVIEQTTITTFVPKKGKVSLLITDILGRQIVNMEKYLDKGSHDFGFRPGNAKVYFFSARYEGINHSIKIVNAGQGMNPQCTLRYLGSSSTKSQLKNKHIVQDFIYSEGDKLLYIGYYDTLQSGMLDSPDTTKTYTFQFATNIPCPGTPTVEYAGTVYNTIQIYNQCWLKENLNVGTLIPGSQDMTDNGIIEKYCYNNEPDSCSKYGGFYLWWEIMQYNSQEGTQGICPSGWHLPTDEEWKVLEGAVDSHFGIGHQTWDYLSPMRGYDAGSRLKSTSGWHYEENGADAYGFSVLPVGFRHEMGGFTYLTYGCYYWSSSVYDPTSVLYRFLYYTLNKVTRNNLSLNEEIGFSVRCLKD